jgi:hypothetical protein
VSEAQWFVLTATFAASLLCLVLASIAGSGRRTGRDGDGL